MKWMIKDTHRYLLLYVRDGIGIYIFLGNDKENVWLNMLIYMYMHNSDMVSSLLLNKNVAVPKFLIMPHPPWGTILINIL